MSRVLVTGGAGFVGSHLVETLVMTGHEVRVLDNFSTGAESNLQTVRQRIDVIAGDVASTPVVQHAVRGCELIFHLAAMPSVSRSVEDPLATHRACVDGTLQVLLAARDAKVRRVLYAASSSAYGNTVTLPKRETDPTAPRSPYAAAKLAGEHYCAAFTQVYGLETVRLRYFNIYGPRQMPNSAYAAVIPRFIAAMCEGQAPEIHGDGEQSRDFTYVADVTQAMLKAAGAPAASGQLYNIAYGERTTVRELVTHLNALLGTQIEPTFVPSRPGDVSHSLACIERARADLDYQPRTGIYTGLKETLTWWLKSRVTQLDAKRFGVAC